ncbi:MAG: 30S ribosomal protein THX [Bacteroidetes bacterium]|nr:30S ribosomal protein THX [Bacteroidota bacterium]
MGKGDKKSRKGKIFMGSYGVSRPHKKKKSRSASPKKIAKKAEKAETAVPKKTAPKKAAKKKD